MGLSLTDEQLGDASQHRQTVSSVIIIRAFYMLIAADEHTDTPGGYHNCATSWSGAAQARGAPGENTNLTCTLPEALLVGFPALTMRVRCRLAVQMLPGWRAALAAHGPQLTKTIMVGGRYKTLRALPVQVALEVVQNLRAQAMVALREELVQLQLAVDAMDALDAAVHGIVYDGVGSDDELEM